MCVSTNQWLLPPRGDIEVIFSQLQQRGLSVYVGSQGRAGTSPDGDEVGAHQGPPTRTAARVGRAPRQVCGSPAPLCLLSRCLSSFDQFERLEQVLGGGREMERTVGSAKRLGREGVGVLDADPPEKRANVWHRAQKGDKRKGHGIFSWPARYLYLPTKIHTSKYSNWGAAGDKGQKLSRRLKPATLSPIISYPVQGQREIVWPHTPLSARGVGFAKERKRDRNGENPAGVRIPVPVRLQLQGP